MTVFDYPISNQEQDELHDRNSFDSQIDHYSILFQLAIPFEKVSTIDLKQKDIYLQESFEELIKERIDLNLPYFLAIAKDSFGSFHPIDATTFMRSYFKHDQKKSAVTRQELLNVQIYKLDSLKDKIFQPFCTLSQLTVAHGHYAKIINACDPNLTPALRGQERFYLGTIFENGLIYEGQYLIYPNLERAFFWYKKSIEDNFLGGHVALAGWYEQGNDVVEKSDDHLIEHLIKLINCLSPCDTHSIQVYQMLADLYNKKGDAKLYNYYRQLSLSSQKDESPKHVMLSTSN